MYLAIAKARELVKAYPTAAVRIDDWTGSLVVDRDSLVEKCPPNSD